MDDDQLTRLPFAIERRQQFYMQFARIECVSSTRFYRINYKMKKGNYE